MMMVLDENQMINKVMRNNPEWSRSHSVAYAKKKKCLDAFSLALNKKLIKD